MDMQNLIDNANQGDIQALNELARRYACGIDVPIDYTISVKYLQIAADLGDPLAMCNLALCYSQGVGIKQDIKASLDLFSKAACQGANIREVVFQNIDIADIKKLALEGHPAASYYYALFLRNTNIDEQHSLLNDASQKGMPLAAAFLAMKDYFANPSSDNISAKNLFIQALDNGYDYCHLLNTVIDTTAQIHIENDLEICNLVKKAAQERLNRPFILIKITNKKWADKFVNNGEVFTQSLGNFRKIKAAGIGDQFEGVSSTSNSESFWKDSQTEQFFEECTEYGIFDEYMSHERIFCLYALEYSENGEFVHPDIRMKQFGDSAIVIWDGNEFCRRLENEIHKKYGDSIWIGYKRVTYNVIFNQACHYDEFSKTEPYAWQNEFRFVIDIANGRVEQTEWDNMTDFAKLMLQNAIGKPEFYTDSGSELITLGDISDICTIFPIEDFLKVSENISTIAKNNIKKINAKTPEHKTLYLGRPFIKL